MAWQEPRSWECSKVSVVAGKNSDWKPQLNVFPDPQSALGFYCYLCSASSQPARFHLLVFSPPALLDQGAPLTWKEVVRDHSDQHSSTLCYLELKGESYLRWKLSLHFATTHSHILQSGEQILQMGSWFISCHALARQQWKRTNKSAPLEGFNKCDYEHVLSC